MMTLELNAAMASSTPPDWSGAVWVGNLDGAALGDVESIHLRESEGYTRARFLVREGSAVRGFIEVDAPGGLIGRAAIDQAISELPRAAVRVGTTPLP